METNGLPMRIEVLGVARGRRIAAKASARLASALASPPLRATSAQIRFTDENGPKGGVAIRCAVSVTLPRRRPIHVEDVATSPRLALDGALAKLDRGLTRLREVAREQRRHPKKYFAAARELAGS